MCLSCDQLGVEVSKRRYMDRATYAEYLGSSEWKRIRDVAWERDRGKCCLCGDPGSDVHHRTYRRIGREQQEDLLTLCRRCHRRVHELGMGLPKRRKLKGRKLEAYRRGVTK